MVYLVRFAVVLRCFFSDLGFAVWVLVVLNLVWVIPFISFVGFIHCVHRCVGVRWRTRWGVLGD